MHWPIALCSDADSVPETRVPPGHGEALDLAAALSGAIEPKAALDPNPPMPAKALQMGHQLRIGEAPIAQKDDLTAPREQERCPLQEVAVDLESHLCTTVLEHAPHQRDSAAPIDHGQPDETVRIPQHGGVQGHIQRLLTPCRYHLLHEGT